MNRLAMDTAAVSRAIIAGHGPALLADLDELGIFRASPRLGAIDFQRPGARIRHATDAAGRAARLNYGLSCDAQPDLVTVSNAGIPAFLANFLDPKIIEVLLTPMKAAEILGGEVQKGNWLTLTAMFEVVEATGETSAYGDYNANGSTGVNVNFPQAQSFHYQTVSQYGEREIENASLAKLDWVNRLNISAAITLNKYQNSAYFFGVAGLQNYGLLNNPGLYPSIAPTAVWSLSATTGDVVYEDIRRLVAQAITQANGTIDQNSSMTLAMSPVSSTALNKTNQYNVNVTDQLTKNFPNLTVKTAPEYSTASGELVQLIVDAGDGQKTAVPGYTEKMRAHAVVTDLSSWKQKKSQGVWGTILFRPYLISSMLGV